MNEEEGLRILYRRFRGNRFSTRDIEDHDVEVLAELIGFTPGRNQLGRALSRLGRSNKQFVFCGQRIRLHLVSAAEGSIAAVFRFDQCS